MTVVQVPGRVDSGRPPSAATHAPVIASQIVHVVAVVPGLQFGIGDERFTRFIDFRNVERNRSERASGTSPSAGISFSSVAGTNDEGFMGLRCVCPV